ncbi:MSMEG_0570 family nitrogen starvation response protein [soil metagenome]
MPEMTFTIRWPDGATQNCYSPSLVMHDFLADETSYPVKEFMSRAVTALTQASERVKARYGMYCTSAAAQIDALEEAGARYPDGEVTVVAMTPGREAFT